MGFSFVLTENEMSYSITVRAKTKHAAQMAAAAALAAQFQHMAEHARDAKAALNSAHAHIDATDEPKEGSEIVVECYGSLGGTWNGTSMGYVSSCNHRVNVYHAPAQTPA